MKVLLTGHTGYIGSVMVPRLIEAGHEVVGLDSGLFEPCVFGDWAQPLGAPSRRGQPVRQLPGQRP